MTGRPAIGLQKACLRRVIAAAWLVATLSGITWADRSLLRLESLDGAGGWTPVGRAAAAEAMSSSDRQIVRMPCTFSQQIDRAAWDHAVSLDLSAARGLQFQLYCENPDSIGGCTLYFHGGGGWYSTAFSVPSAGQWNTISVDRLATSMEEKPAGWSRIDRIRIAFWPGSTQDTAVHLSGFAVASDTNTIALIRSESAVEEKADVIVTVQDISERVGGMLDGLGLAFTPYSDYDLNADCLRGKTLAILPYTPVLAEAAVAALKEFTDKGGKLLSFYEIPSAVAALAGLKEGRHVRAPADGQFASIRASERPIGGLPAQVDQASWNIREMLPAEKSGWVAARWFDAAGKDTGLPAIVVTDRAVHMTHILLRDDPARKPLLLLAIVGHLMPAAWEASARFQVAQAGVVGPYPNAETAVTTLRGLPASSPCLAEVETLSVEADAALRAGRYPVALDRAGRLHAALTRAWCASLEPQAGEFRGFWCHNALGVPPLTWDESVRILAENGFNALFPNMLWGGSAYYPSKVLPIAPEVAEQGDQVAACLAACAKYGVACHVWKVCWNMADRAPAAFRARMKETGRTQVRLDGKAEDAWLCPSHPDNQQLEIDAMVEVATQYNVAGLHFDYIRYPDRLSCFCDGCRTRFEAALAKPVAGWPKAVFSDPELHAKWLDFRREQITKVVRAVSEQARQARPGIKISAAVFRNAPADRDSVAQDWPAWCAGKLVDFVCPMDYTDQDADFERVARQQQVWASGLPCYPGIGLSVWPQGDGITRLAAQVAVTRRIGTGGFMVFNYGAREAKDILPLCGLGLTRPQRP